MYFRHYFKISILNDFLFAQTITNFASRLKQCFERIKITDKAG